MSSTPPAWSLAYIDREFAQRRRVQRAIRKAWTCSHDEEDGYDPRRALTEAVAARHVLATMVMVLDSDTLPKLAEAAAVLGVPRPKEDT